MIKANYHTHSNFCDGKGDPEEYVKAAIEEGFKIIGFSSHAPLPFENDWTMDNSRLFEYSTRINQLKAKYAEQIEIYLGLEADYVPGIVSPSDSKLKALNLDYNIGSIHILRDREKCEFPTVDTNDEIFSKILSELYNNDIKKLVSAYYSLVSDMTINHPVNIIGHFDLVKMNNRENKYFNEKDNWYKEEIEKTLDIIAGTGIIIEINTGGLVRGKTDSIYPSPWILKRCFAKKIRIVVNSDIHAPNQTGKGYLDAVQIAIDAGYKNQRILTKGRWVDSSLM